MIIIFLYSQEHIYVYPQKISQKRYPPKDISHILDYTKHHWQSIIDNDNHIVVELGAHLCVSQKDIPKEISP